MKQRRASKPVLALGLILFLVAVIGFYTAYSSARNTEAVVTAAQNIPAFSVIKSGDISYQQVPKASVGANDLTEADYKSNYLDKKINLVVTGLELQGQRLDTREIAKNVSGSFAVVDPDERVIAVTTSLTGADIGTIRAGDVVDVTQAGNAISGAGATANYAKVLCISEQADGCAGVLPAGFNVSTTSSSLGNSNQEPVNVLLAVAAANAPTLAGATVSLALDPFCQVNGGQVPNVPLGSFVSTGATSCQIDSADASRIAAQNAQVQTNSKGGNSSTGMSVAPGIK